MGAEQLCTAHRGDDVSEGKAHLDATRLLFRGAFKLDLVLADLTSVSADGAFLVLEGPSGTVRLDLGTRAARWADKINNPKSCLDKLGVASGAIVAALGVTDPTLLAELGARAGRIYTGTPGEPVDLIFLGLDQPSELARVTRLRWYLKRDGALWTLRPKGSALLPESKVRSTLRGAGFVDVKVCSLSDTLTADKFLFAR